MTDGRRVADVLEDRPDLESSLEDVYEVDQEMATWTFDDVPVDSGAFGHLVSEGVVEKTDGEYRLADPDAVRTALEGEGHPDESPASTGRDVSLSLSSPSLGARGVAMVAATLAALVAVRVLSWGAVFRDGRVVLSGNDPYAYRYLVEETLRQESIGALPVGVVPESIATGEPFLVAALAWVSGLLGGIEASGAVLAVYPVAAALFAGLALYGIAMRVTEDRRVALSSVLLLAVTPAHAFRTSLGYADHHAFDYLWLALTALALVVLLTGERDETDLARWLAAAGLGVGIAGQVLAWDNGPLLVVPVAAIITLGVLLDVRADRSPLAANAPVLAGIALGAVLTFGGHAVAGWHSTTVAATPALLFAGSVAVVAAGELAARLDRDVRELAALELAAGVGILAVVAVALPEYWQQLVEGLGRIAGGRNIAETQSLFADVVGFILVLGFILVFAVPMLAWASVRLADDTERWLVPVVYGWFFFALAVFQVRFVGELALFTALFAGFGFVWTAAWVDLTEPPAAVDGTDWTDWRPGRPDARTVVAVVALFALVGGLGLLQSGIKVQQVTIEDDVYQTADHLAEYADERGWESQSESYVFSRWGRNRMYNYFVNGESRSFGYARANYRQFYGATDPAVAANLVDDGRVRFVVTGPFPVQKTAVGARLHAHYGSRSADADGLARYRAIFATESGGRKAFLVVPGATLNGTAAANATVSLSTDVQVPGASFTYTRQASTNASGAFSVTVPYPGTYELSSGGETWTVDVPETAVMEGTSVTADA